ncbi:mRNA (2'-O-methyladenosine-N(6)-)-methyltransferase [Malassezia obtusa]|uniref:mRNA m(6)A methyltransferase n=1 Tax=Malassezia obtusa TaxID=76774 RepID=A0AAF0E4S5_9BASI|nr:mRNA (2'-O-methyladenosine-N(6)-)-methyltransferase [Malassezia obtusa]
MSDAAAAAELAARYLRRPTAKERLLAQLMHSSDNRFHAVCEQITRDACRMHRAACTKVHFRPLRLPHTNEALGHCGYLNSCHRKATCKFVHYEVDAGDAERAVWTPAAVAAARDTPLLAPAQQLSEAGLDAWRRTRHWDAAGLPAQWIQCDLRTFDLASLGKFDVVVADPPWDIHMSLPYGTLSDEQMYALPVPDLQDEGLLFLWVTGRAMELGRALLRHWGYERIDELVWVKINQLQRLIRTGRTGHWLNHTKEHCFVGLKRRGARADAPADAPAPGTHLALPSWAHRGMGNDVIVAPVRDTSRKPDELYAMIEKLCPGGRKVELFGRQHNVRRGWLTLGNQLRGTNVVSEHTPLLADAPRTPAEPVRAATSFAASEIEVIVHGLPRDLLAVEANARVLPRLDVPVYPGATQHVPVADEARGAQATAPGAPGAPGARTVALGSAEGGAEVAALAARTRAALEAAHTRAAPLAVVWSEQADG